MMRLGRGGIEARDYYIETIPWKIMSAIFDPNKVDPVLRSIRIDNELGQYIWENFSFDDYVDMSG